MSMKRPSLLQKQLYDLLNFKDWDLSSKRSGSHDDSLSTGAEERNFRQYLLIQTEVIQKLKGSLEPEVWKWLQDAVLEFARSITKSLAILWPKLKLSRCTWDLRFILELGPIKSLKSLCQSPFSINLNESGNRVGFRIFQGRSRRWVETMCRRGGTKFRTFAATLLQSKRVCPKVPTAFVQEKKISWAKGVLQAPRQSPEFIRAINNEIIMLPDKHRFRWEVDELDLVKDFSQRACVQSSRKRQGIYGYSRKIFGEATHFAGSVDGVCFEKGINFPTYKTLLEHVHFDQEQCEVFSTDKYPRKLVALEEPLKVRMITLSNWWESPLWSTFQKDYSRHLAKRPEILSGKEVTLESFKPLVNTFQKMEERNLDPYWVSDDGDAATDSISHELTKSLSTYRVPPFLRTLWNEAWTEGWVTLGELSLDEIAELIKHCLEQLPIPDIAIEMLIAENWGSTPLKIYEPHSLAALLIPRKKPVRSLQLKSLAASLCDCLQVINLDHPISLILGDRDKLFTVKIKPRTGQPMGDRRSFPMLSEIHYLVKRSFFRKHGLIKLGQCFVENGDDGLSVIPKALIPDYKEWMSNLWGLNPLKTWISKKMLSFNSCCYRYCDGTLSKIGFFRWNLVFRRDKYGEQCKDIRIWQTVKEWCPAKYQEALFANFLIYWKDEVKRLCEKGNNLFLPQNCGGVGLSPPDSHDWYVTPRQFLAVKLADYHLEKGRFSPFRTVEVPLVRGMKKVHREFIYNGTRKPGRNKAILAFPGASKVSDSRKKVWTKPLPKGICGPMPFFHHWGLLDSVTPFLDWIDDDEVIEARAQTEHNRMIKNLADWFGIRAPL